MSKRRANQEGPIHFRKKDGKWRAQITIEGRRVSFTAKTKQECITWLKYLQDQVESGMSYSGATMTVNSYCEMWLTAIKRKSPTENLHPIRDICSRYILPQFGEVKLATFDPYV